MTATFETQRTALTGASTTPATGLTGEGRTSERPAAPYARHSQGLPARPGPAPVPYAH